MINEKLENNFNIWNFPLKNFSKFSNNVKKSKLVRNKSDINTIEENNTYYINGIYKKPKTKQYQFRSLDNSINDENDDIELKYVTRKIPLFSDENFYDFDKEPLSSNRKIRRNNSYDNRFIDNSYFDSNYNDNNNIIDGVRNNNINFNFKDNCSFGYKEKGTNVDEEKIKELLNEIYKLKKENKILKTQNIEFKMKINKNKKREIEENFKNKNLKENNKLIENLQNVISQLKMDIKKKDNIIYKLRKRRLNKVSKNISFSIVNNKKRNKSIPKRNNSSNKLKNNSYLKNFPNNKLKICSQVIKFQLIEKKEFLTESILNKLEDNSIDNNIFYPKENNKIYLEKITFDKEMFNNYNNIKTNEEFFDTPNCQNYILESFTGTFNSLNEDKKHETKEINNILYNTNIDKKNNNNPINKNNEKKPQKEKTSLIMSVLNDDCFGLFENQKKIIK